MASGVSGAEQKLLGEAVAAVESKRELLGDDIANQILIETERVLIGIEVDSAACDKLSQSIKDVMKVVAPITTKSDLDAAMPEIKVMVNKVCRTYGMAVNFNPVNGFMFVGVVGGFEYYAITYSTAHGSAPAGKLVQTNYGESYALTDDDLPTLTADGYTFKGWTLDGAVVDVGTTVSGDVTMVAEWEVVPDEPDGGKTDTADPITYADFAFGPKFRSFPVKGVAGWKLAQRILGGSEPADDLPAGYTRLAYLVCTGEQYINTRIVPANKKISAEVKFKIDKLHTGGTYESTGIVGSIGKDGTDNIQFTVAYADWRTKINNFASYNGEWDANEHTVRLNTSTGTYLDDTQITDTQYTIAETNTYPMLLGAANYNGRIAVSGNKFTLIGRLDYGVFRDEDTIIGDFIAALDGNNRPCMYDKVSGETFYNAGSGEFIAGPAVSA